jgi:hypothetical protein
MKAVLNFVGGLQFNATCDENTVQMDAKAPLGKGSGMTPKELVAARQWMLILNPLKVCQVFSLQHF